MVPGLSDFLGSVYVILAEAGGRDLRASGKYTGCMGMRAG